MCYGVDWELPLNRCLYHPTDDTQGLSSSSTIGRSKRAPSLGGSAGAIQEVNLYSQLRMAARPVLAFARGSFRQPDNAEDRPTEPQANLKPLSGDVFRRGKRTSICSIEIWWMIGSCMIIPVSALAWLTRVHGM